MLAVVKTSIFEALVVPSFLSLKGRRFFRMFRLCCCRSSQVTTAYLAATIDQVCYCRSSRSYRVSHSSYYKSSTIAQLPQLGCCCVASVTNVASIAHVDTVDQVSTVEIVLPSFQCLKIMLSLQCFKLPMSALK